MSINFSKIYLFIFLYFLAFPLKTVASNTNVNLDIYFCNNNSVCEDTLGENHTYCSSDCEDVPTTTPGGGGGGSSFPIPSAPILPSSSVSNTAPVVTPSSSSSTPDSTNDNTEGESVALSNPLFFATGLNGRIRLSWQKNTETALWKKIIIRRSALFYPETIFRGGVIYEGLGKVDSNGNFYIDDISLESGKRYYYTLFIQDREGRLSTGVSVSALTTVFTLSSSTLEVPIDELPPEVTLPKSENFQQIKWEDLLIYTGDKTVIEIPSDKIPKSAYAGFLTIKDSSGQRQTYILGNIDKGMFAVFPKSGSGDFEVVITILDNKHQILAQTEGKVSISAPEEQSLPVVFFEELKGVLKEFITNWRAWIGVLLAGLFWIFRLL